MSKHVFCDHSGKVFGRWTAIKVVPPTDSCRRYKWVCRCACGNEKIVEAASLVRGSSKSCGCLLRETTIKRSTIHGCTKEGNQPPEYSRWLNMNARCYRPTSPDFKNYGGRGIKVCQEWQDSFVAYRDYIRSIGFDGNPRISIDRINNNGNYEPGNVRLADANTQRRNSRQIKVISAFGETHCLKDWARRINLNYWTLRGRLLHGWSEERALTTPHRAHKHKTQ